MKRIIQRICLCLAGFTCLTTFNLVYAQTASWDSTHRPAAYLSRTEHFRTYSKSREDIIFLGNSITAGTDWHELLNNPHAKNRGISGDITFGILERLEDIISGQPAKIFILIGINDLQWNTPEVIILHNYSRIIKRIKSGSPATKIYFHTLLPLNATFKNFKSAYRHKEENILKVNAGLKILARKEQITLIDLYPHFIDKENQLHAAYTNDGLHLNAAGYSLWAEILKAGKYLD
jgi:lysophospholipase L1-like esterase